MKHFFEHQVAAGYVIPFLICPLSPRFPSAFVPVGMVPSSLEYTTGHVDGWLSQISRHLLAAVHAGEVGAPRVGAGGRGVGQVGGGGEGAGGGTEVEAAAEIAAEVAEDPNEAASEAAGAPSALLALLAPPAVGGPPSAEAAEPPVAEEEATAEVGARDARPSRGRGPGGGRQLIATRTLLSSASRV